MPEKRVMKPKTLLQKLKDGEWKEFTDEEKADSQTLTQNEWETFQKAIEIWNGGRQKKPEID